MTCYIVQQRRALLRRGRNQIDQQPAVIELSVVVNHSATQTFGVDCGQTFECFFSGEYLGRAETVFAGEQVIDLQTETIERGFPPVIVWNYETQIADDMWRVLPQQAPFLERLDDERDVALFQIADATVHELGAAAGGTLSEVALFEEQDIVATRSRVNGDPDTGRSTSNDDHVPRFRLCGNPAKHFRTIHEVLPGIVPVVVRVLVPAFVPHQKPTTRTITRRKSSSLLKCR